MSLKSRLKRLEARSGLPRCPECELSPTDPVKLAKAKPAPGNGQGWDGYPQPPHCCKGCGRTLKFTLRLGLGDVGPNQAGGVGC